MSHPPTSPNWDLLRQVALNIQNQPASFSTLHFFPRETKIAKQHGCGTACCIAGHVVLEGYNQGLLDEAPDDSMSQTIRHAKALLRLPDPHCANIFYGTSFPEDWPDLDRAKDLEKVIWGSFPHQNPDLDAVRDAIVPFIEEVIKLIEHNMSSEVSNA